MSQSSELRVESSEMKPVRCGCGGEAVTDYLIGETGEGISWYVYCKECETETKWYDTEAEAITAWNRAMSGVAKDINVPNKTAKVSENATRLYCGECGERLDDYDDICGEPPIKYCPQCGCRLIWGED